MSTFYTGYCLGRALTAPSVTCTDIGLHYLYRYVKVCPVVFLASFRITTLV